jgi:hypothetical protein
MAVNRSARKTAGTLRFSARRQVAENVGQGGAGGGKGTRF